MPIEVDAEVRRLSQEEFGRLAYEVMDHIFQIHNELAPSSPRKSTLTRFHSAIRVLSPM